MKNKRMFIILIIFVIVMALVGGTLAYFSWRSATNTAVTFTVEAGFSCAADGGGNITSSQVMLAPSSCTNSTYAIKRTVKVMPTVKNGKVYMDLWLNINKLDTGLKNSDNFKYVLSTSSTSCDEGVVASGNFKGKTVNDRVILLNGIEYTQTQTETYYLYVWLDSAEESTETMNQTFNLSLGGSCTDSSQASTPVLDSNGMIPVTISSNGIVTTIKEDNNSWYSYNQQEWANAVLVDSSVRSTYLGTTGKVIPEDNILAYYVWIPRYKYKIRKLLCSELSSPSLDTNPECYSYSVTDTEKTALVSWWKNFLVNQMNIQYSEEEALADVTTILNEGGAIIEAAGGNYISYSDFISAYNQENSNNQITPTPIFNSSGLANSPREINVFFEEKNETKSMGDAINDYLTHPAFTFGTKELNGIWVGKFETTGADTQPTIKPNTSSLRSQNVANQFQTALKFSGGTLSSGNVTFTGNSTYGLSSSTDSHMMKNSEWGAVAYLSHSKYGINGEIRINNYWNNGTLTGCGASSVNGESTSSCEIAYGGATTYPQSTTGNISGIFDMSGGAYEYVMGNFNQEVGRSGFTTLPPSKYYDNYTISSYTSCTTATCGGHALSETAGWYNDVEIFVSSGHPWFERGGYNGDGAIAGAFDFRSGRGDGYNYDGFRSVVFAS